MDRNLRILNILSSVVTSAMLTFLLTTSVSCAVYVVCTLPLSFKVEKRLVAKPARDALHRCVKVESNLPTSFFLSTKHCIPLKSTANSTARITSDLNLRDVLVGQNLARVCHIANTAMTLFAVSTFAPPWYGSCGPRYLAEGLMLLKLAWYAILEQVVDNLPWKAMMDSALDWFCVRPYLFIDFFMHSFCLSTGSWISLG